MITSESCIRLCPDCPNRQLEGTSQYDPITGDLIDRKARYMNARLEFISGPEETPTVPAQEFAVRFIDTEGSQTAAFLPGTQLEDIASCKGRVVASSYGFFGPEETV